MRKTALIAITSAIVGALVATPLAVHASHQFTDVPDSNTFHADVAWLADSGVTKGCNPPANDEYCPKDVVTRETMAAFLHRLAINQVVHAATAVSAQTAEDADTVDGKHADSFLGKTEQAADAETLDGMDSSEFVSSVAAGTGISGGGSGGDVLLSLVDSFRLPQGCADNEIPGWSSTDSSWNCAPDSQGPTVATGTCTWPANETSVTCSLGTAFAAAPVVVVTRTNNQVSNPWISSTTTTDFTMQSGSQPTSEGEFNFVAIQP